VNCYWQSSNGVRSDGPTIVSWGTASHSDSVDINRIDRSHYSNEAPRNTVPGEYRCFRSCGPPVRRVLEKISSRQCSILCSASERAFFVDRIGFQVIR